MKKLYKDDSLLMKILSWILFFNKDFMTTYTTTIGETIYLPTYAKDCPQEQLDAILAHEYIHVLDYKKEKLLFMLKYLFPQILFPLALLILPFSWVASLICAVLFALPLPAPWRTQYEIRGYKMTLAALNIIWKKQGKSDDFIITNLNEVAEVIDKKCFKSSAYYFMWPFGVEKKLKQAIADIRTGDIFIDGSVYSQSRDAVLGNYQQD